MSKMTSLLHFLQRFEKTRLKILSRSKSPNILQKLLSNSKELPSPRPTKLLKNSKRFQKGSKDSKGIKKNPKESKRFQKIQKDSKSFQMIQKVSFKLKEPARAQKANGFPKESKTKRRPRCLGA